MPRSTHTQPSMFSPEELPYDSLTVTITVHLDGPASRAESWVTISHPTDGQLACYGPDRGSVSSSTPTAVAEVAADAVRTALRQLATF